MNAKQLLLMPCLALVWSACTSHPLTGVGNAVSVSMKVLDSNDGCREYSLDLAPEQGRQLAQILARTRTNPDFEPHHVYLTRFTSYHFTMPDGKARELEVGMFTPDFWSADAGCDRENGIYLFQTEEDKRVFKSITDRLVRQLPPTSQWKASE